MTKEIKIAPDAFNDYVERAVLAVLNSFISAEVVMNFGLLTTYEYVVVPTAAIVTLFAPFFITPFVSVLYVSVINYNMILQRALTPYQGYLDIFLLVLLGILLPVALELKFKTLQAFISIDSVIANTAFPVSAIFLFSGISERRGVAVNALSSLPLAVWLIYPYFADPSVFRLSIGVALVLAGSAIMGVRKAFSPVGAVLPAVALYYVLPSISTIKVIEATALAVAINAVPLLIEFQERKAIEMSSLEKLRLSLINEMEEAIVSLQKISKVDNEEISSLAKKDLEFLTSLYDELERCKERKCTEEISFKFSKAKEEIGRQIDGEVFEVIVRFNEKARKLRKLNLPVEEIPPTDRKFTLDSNGVDYVYGVVSSINSSVDAAIKSLNEVVKNVNQIFGTEYGLLLAKNVDKVIEASEGLLNKDLIGKMKDLVELEKDLLTRLKDQSITEVKPKLVRDLNLIDLNNPSFYEVNLLIQATKEINKLVDSEVEKVKGLTAKGGLPPFIADRVLKLYEELKKSVEGSKSLYEKLSNFSAVVDYLNETLDIASKREELATLSEFLERNTNQILNALSDGHCISLSDMGIDESFTTYVIYWLQSKGIKAKKVKNSICSS